VVDRLPRYTLDRFDHVEHGERLGAPEVESAGKTSLHRPEGKDVSGGEVVNVNVVANARPVGRVVIVAEDRECAPLPCDGVQHRGDEMRLRLVVFTVELRAPPGVEVTQRNELEPPGVPARLEHVLDDLIALCRRRGLDDDPSARRRIAEAYEQVTSLRALGFRSMVGDGPQQLYMKLASSEMYTELLELALDLERPCGAVTGSVTERDWVHDFLGGLAGTLAGGTSEIQRRIIARHALGLPRD